MSIRTIEELRAAAKEAHKTADVAALERCIVELEAIGTAESLASAVKMRGSVESLRGHSRTAIEHYQRALELFSEIGDQRSAADLVGDIGSMMHRSGDHAGSLDYGRRALDLHEALGDRSGMANDHLNLGNVSYATGDFPTALECYHRALAIREELGDVLGVSLLISSIGNVYDGIGNYPQALAHFYRALDMKQGLDDQLGVARLIGNIGVVYENTGNYEKALEYKQRSLTLREALDDRHGIAYSTGGIGTIYATMGNYSLALEYYRRALAMHEVLGERDRAAHVTGNIINALIYKGDVDEAETMLAVFEATEVKHPTSVVYRYVSRALIQRHRGQLDEAMKTFGLALEYAQDFAIPLSQARLHQYLRDLCQMRNDFAGYIEHNNEYNRITEEINGKDTATKLALLEAEQKMAKERAEHEKHLSILHSTLPKTIADRVARGETVNDHYDNAAVIFLDIVGFTTISENLSSDQVVQLLEQIFTTLDAVCEKHDVMKIKTIGDSYMAVAFPTSVPHSVRNDTSSLDLSIEERVISSEARNVAERAASAALDMLHEVSHVVSPIGSPIQARIGVHSGAVTAGIIGTTRMQFDVWGDTVNVASRMESTSELGRIHVSSSFALAIKGEMAKEQKGETDVIPSVSEEQSVRGGTSSPFPVSSSLRERGSLEIKGKGIMTTYWLESVS